MSTNNIKDYYYILGLDRNAAKDDIKKAYRKLSLKFHPDQNAGDKFFEDRFKDINEAYETLVDDVSRKQYDERLRNHEFTSEFTAASKQDPPKTETRQTPPQNQRPASQNKKKKSREIFFVIIGAIVFISPIILRKIANNMEKKDSGAGSSDPAYTTPPLSKGDSVTGQYGANATSPSAPQTSQTSADTTNSYQTDVDAALKDDMGLTAGDALNRFFQALSSGDCTTAWNMTYNPAWISSGQDWFCSANAFGGVRKISMHTMYPVVQTAAETQIYADYYAEDVYNGNKCFKQNITLQKINYTDNKQRWTIVKMKNLESPVDCSE